MGSLAHFYQTEGFSNTPSYGQASESKHAGMRVLADEKTSTQTLPLASPKEMASFQLDILSGQDNRVNRESFPT